MNRYFAGCIFVFAFSSVLSPDIHAAAVKLGSLIEVQGPGIQLNPPLLDGFYMGSLTANADQQTTLIVDLPETTANGLDVDPASLFLDLINQSGNSISSLLIEVGSSNGSSHDFSVGSGIGIASAFIMVNVGASAPDSPNTAYITTPDLGPDRGIFLNFDVGVLDSDSFALGGDLAIRLTATFVPEPSVLLICGLTGLLLYRRPAKGRGHRLSSNV
jgi:hypothetical protein